MDIDMNKQHWMDKKCPPINCRKKQCECGLEKVFLSAVLGDDSENSPIAPKNGDYCNAIVVYEANGHIYIYSKEGIPTLFSAEGNVEDIIEEIEERLTATQEGLARETLDRTAADETLQDEIDAIKNSPDVVDIVPTYAALQAYDTSSLGDNDIIRVLADEGHNGASTYYRWDSQSETWTYIGEVGDYYTKGQVDDLLDTKQDTLTAGENITIDNNVISATDTTYTDFEGTDGTEDGEAGLVPAPLAADADKFLKSDGTWEAVGGGGVAELTSADYNWPENNPDGVAIWTLNSGVYVSKDGVRLYKSDNDSAPNTDASMVVMQHENSYPSAILYNWSAVQGFKTGGLVLGYSNNAGTLVAGNLGNRIVTEVSRPLVQTTGTSTTDVMSQNAVTSMVYADPATRYNVRIGNAATGNPSLGGAVIIGDANASASAQNSISIGQGANANYRGSIAFGSGSQTSAIGEINVGSVWTNNGYNNTNYRLISGVHDPVNAQDAATKAYVDANAGGGGIQELTTADYNYPASNPNGIAHWLLEPGVYVTAGAAGSDINFYRSNSDSGNLKPKTLIIISRYGESTYSSAVVYRGDGWEVYTAQVSNGGAYTNASGRLLMPADIYADPANKTKVQIGNTAATGNTSVALGRNAQASGSASVALGSYSTATSQGELSVGGNLLSGSGYNNTSYRLITNVHDPVNPQDAATKAYVDANAGGVTPVQTTGTSTTDVMSQNATSKMIFVDPANATSGIAIGGESPQATVSRAIAIGNDSRANYSNSVALGYYARTSHSNSVALGAGAITTNNGQLSIQKVSSGYGYNNTVYTLLSGLYDPQNDHDAANKQYVDSKSLTYINLTPTNISTSTIDVTADKTVTEINDLVTAGVPIEFKMTVPTAVGSFPAGTYFLQPTFVSSTGITASAARYNLSRSFEYEQQSGNTGIITIGSL